MSAPIKQWRPFMRSMTGASHQRRGLGCQDSIDVRYDDAIHPMALAMAVSDGHGSAKNAKQGATLATQVAPKELLRATTLNSDVDLATIERYAKQHLPRLVVSAWIDKILKKEPNRSDTGNLLSEYGCTLLATLITPRYLLCLQIGDGDILFVDKVGQVTRPIPHDPRLLANETTSLSQVDRLTQQPLGSFEMNVVLHPLAQDASDPCLVVMSTDGYANSFADKKAFERVGPDLLRLLRVQGWNTVTNQIDDWLTEATEQGSGDDVTLGFLLNTSELNTELLAGEERAL
jgi:serine/threonine protein phosphatase PrpC